MYVSNKFLFIQKIVLSAMWQTLPKAQGIKESIWGDRHTDRILEYRAVSAVMKTHIKANGHRKQISLIHSGKLEF